MKSLSVLVPGLHEKWRPNQQEVIEQVDKSNKRFIAIQAPTGFGKSLSAAGICLSNGGRSLILTQTRQLGKQYYDDFYRIGLKKVEGRGNFDCVLVPEKTADLAPCVAGAKCSYKRGGCPYYDQKHEAVDSLLVSMPIQYFLNEANFSGDFSNVSIIFIDEAHKLESTMQNFIEIRLSKDRFGEEGCPLPQEYSVESLQEWSIKAGNVIFKELDEITEALEFDPTNDILTIRGIKLKALANTLGKFKIVDSTWVVEEDSWALILKPVWTGKHMEEFLFRHSTKIVFMSATLPRTMVESFGVIDYDYINLPSNFDAKSRPVIWIPAANLARSASDPNFELKKLTRTVDVIADKFKNQKGILHTVNYRISEHIMKNAECRDRIITHTNAGEREYVLEQFKKSKDNSILMSPSFTEGVDLPYDQCRWQIICKIPYNDLGNKQVRARNDSDPQWYATSTIVSMIQAYGRIMRAEDDSGVTYILDTSLMNLINRWRTIFDQLSWFLDALYISENKQIVPFSEYMRIRENPSVD
jgi:ATP-dependent DNA helicase DinG